MDCYSRSALNFFVSNTYDRITNMRGNEAWVQNRLADPTTRLVPVWNLKNLIDDEKAPHAVLLSPAELEHLPPISDSITFLGKDQKTDYFGIDFRVNGSSQPPDLGPLGHFADLKSVGPLLDWREGSLLAYARAMCYWHEHHRFCGVCGSETRNTHAGHVRVCTNVHCGQQHFPRTDPAIIVLVADGDHALLGRQAVWPKSMYSTIAGFVEPGESLEAAVKREVFEETGVGIANVNYHSSQPWPFPSSIMLGFTAEAESREIHLNDSELEDARWISRDDMAQALTAGSIKLPTPISIAYRLIEGWFDSGRAGALREILKSLGQKRSYRG
jgi:NAD+ diphosphatase